MMTPMTPSKWKMRGWRRDQGLTQGQAGELAGVTRKTWHEWETGKTRPSGDQMERLYQVTGGAIEPNDFYNLPPVAATAKAA